MERTKQQQESAVSPTWIHPHQLITGQDLERFRQRMIIDLEDVIKKHLRLLKLNNADVRRAILEATNVETLYRSAVAGNYL